MAEFFSVPKRSGFSPPSPELDFPCNRFIAMAIQVCASSEIEPYDIAPVLNRFTISDTGSTSSNEIGFRLDLNSKEALNV